MKQFLILLLAILMMACHDEGTIVDQSDRHIIINCREYRFIKIVPSDGASAVWILVPKDASVQIPQSTAYTRGCGKNCTVIEECIVINE